MSRAVEIADLIFVGFNNRVSALDRENGQVVWTWKGPKCSHGSFVTLLFDGDRLIVSMMGHTACIHPLTGREIWVQPFKGSGWGHATLASARAASEGAPASAAGAQAQQQAAAMMTTTTVGS